MLGDRFLLQCCVESRIFAATLVWHTQEKRGKGSDCSQCHSMRKERGICAMSRVAGTYTVKLFCLPGSQQEACQCVDMDKLGMRALVFLPTGQERGMITCQIALWMSGALKHYPAPVQRHTSCMRRIQTASSIQTYLLVGCKNLSFETSLLLCPFPFVLYSSVFLQSC